MNKFFGKLGRAASSTNSRGAYITAALIAVAVVFNVVIYSLTLLLGLFIYSPQSDDMSLTGDSELLFGEAIEKGKTVTVIFCNTEDTLKNHDTGAFVYKTANALKEKYPDFINLKYINVITGRDENGERFSLEPYKKDMMGNETKILSSSVIFTSGRSWRVITDLATSVGYADFYSLDSTGAAYSYNGEEVITSMIAWVLTEEHGRAYFTQGHGETADVAFSNLLSCAGYYVDLINLKKEEVPTDADLLVISNPISDFERGEGIRTEIERLTDYVKRGGKVYVTVDPYVRELPQLQEFLSDMGITVTDSTTEGGIYSRDLIKDSTKAISTDGLAFVATFGEGQTAKKISEIIGAYGTGSVLVSDVARLTLQDNAEGILYASSTASLVTAGKTSDTGGGYCAAAVATVENREGEDGKIFVIPSVFLTSGDLLSAKGYSNRDFVYALFAECMGAKTTPYGCNSVVYDTTTLENLTMGAARTYTAILFAIPLSLSVWGAVVIIRRRNR